MSRIEFLKVLDYELGNIDAGHKADILADFKEHFDIAESGGKNEDEICAVLGDPREIAREFIADYKNDLQSHDFSMEIEISREHGNDNDGSGCSTGAPADKIKKIKIEVFNCDLCIEGTKSSSGAISVEFDDDYPNRFTTEIIDGVYFIKEKPFRQFSDNLFSRLFSFGHNSEAEMSVAVPLGFNGTVDASTASGDIEANNLFSLESLKLKTASGDIEASDIVSRDEINLASGSGDIEATRVESDGSINLSTGSGDISLDRCKSAAINLSTGSGDIESEDSIGRLSAKTGSGEIEVSGHTGAVEGKTGSGDVEIETDELSNETDYSTGSGDIHIDCKKISARVKATTGSGDISLRVKQLTADVSAKTATGDIEAEIGRGSDVKFLFSTGRTGSVSNEFEKHPGGSHTVSLETRTGDISVKTI